MYRRAIQLLSAVMLVLAMSLQFVLPQPAYSQSFYARTHRAGVYQRHPIISRTLTGAALGGVTGAVIGAVTKHHRVGRGALIGAGVGSGLGLGYGLYRNRQYTGRWF